MKLFELTENYRSILDMLENEELDQERVKEAFALVNEQLGEKVENTAKLLKSLEADSEAIKAEEERLKARRKAVDNKIEFLKTMLEDSLKVAGIDKVKGKLFTISMRKTPLKVVIKDSAVLPSEFKTTEVIEKVDKKALISAFKETGELINGVSFETSKVLSIR